MVTVEERRYRTGDSKFNEGFPGKGIKSLKINRLN
jgi:hypothetical protein